ncbi:MAG: patatin-like phospholipase family protein [Hyphomonas sp.]|jgi:NTE family protein
MTLTGFRRPAALLAMLLAPLAALAEGKPCASPDPDRPSIGLVLSGGGALGIAHAGAIRELEARGIRPDCVVGTSMGAVMGGLYAAGLTPDQLETVVQEANWTGVFSPGTDRDKLTYRQKQQQADFPGTAGLGVSLSGLLLPAGAVSDQALMKELRRFTPARARLDSFDELEIPFRAVATDIATGEVHVMASGELPMAMRASMSVPGVFPAVQVDGKLLVDGGLSANIPVSVARNMGADVVIVVWTPTELMPQEKITSAVDVIAQTVSLLILANERTAISSLQEGRDVLARVATAGFNPAAFNRGPELIAAGKAAIADQATRLASLRAGRPPVAYAGLPVSDPPVISFVRIENSSRLDQSLLEAKVMDLAGEPADPARIDEALDRIYALGPFERVDYVFDTRNGSTGLIIRAEDRQPNAGRVRLGLTVENDFNTESDAAVSVDFRSPALDAYGSELQARATIGDFNEVAVEYFRLLDPQQYWFTALRGQIRNQPVNIFSTRGFKEAGYDLTFGLIGLDAGYQFSNVGEVRLGIDLGTGRAKLNEGAAPFSEIDVDIGRLVASGGYDTLDDPFFPRRGLQGDVRWTRGFEGLGDNGDFETVTASGLAAFSEGPNTLIAALSGGEQISGRTPLDAFYRVGGLFSLSGYRKEELTGEGFVTGQLIYRRAFGQDSEQLFGVPLFAGASLEAGDVWQAGEGLDFGELRIGGSVYVAAKTAFGPVYLAFGRSEGGRQSAYLLIGRTF